MILAGKVKDGEAVAITVANDKRSLAFNGEAPVAQAA
jgi:hypothetical protein